MQAAEGCIRELKRGVSRLMIKTGLPKKLWDHCIILMAMIRSCTTNSIYMTAGQVPETLITGETADISRICQFGWYDWVMYHDPAKFPDNKLTLDQKRDFDTTPFDTKRWSPCEGTSYPPQT
jgi:hypothetical protein